MYEVSVPSDQGIGGEDEGIGGGDEGIRVGMRCIQS